jgi:hypothetical protein
MFARVMTGDISPEKAELFAQTMRDTVIPQARRLQGFKGGYWLIDREVGKVLGITLYESEQALRASQAQADRIRAEASQQMGLPEPAFRDYEVIAQVGAMESMAA